MAVINFAGWNAGSVNQDGASSSGGTLSVVAGAGARGENALRCNPTGTNTGVFDLGGFSSTGQPTTFSGLAALYGGFWFKYHLAPATGDEPIAAWYSSSSALRGELRLNSGGFLVLYDAALVARGTSATPLDPDTWYYIRGRMGGAASAQTQIQVCTAPTYSPVTVIDYTGNFGGTIAFMRLGKGVNRNGNAVDFYYAVVVIDTASVPIPQYYVRNGQPTANGSTYTFSGSGAGANDYTSVDEVIISTADYVRSGAQNELALFAMANCSAMGIANGDTIISVRAGASLREATAGASAYVLRIKSGATNSDNAALDPGTTFIPRFRLVNTDPATATTWTQSGVDGLEIGVLDSSTGGRVDVAWVDLAVLAQVSPAAAGTADAGATATGDAGANVYASATVDAGADALGVPQTYSAAGSSTVIATAEAEGIAAIDVSSDGIGADAQASVAADNYADDQSYALAAGVAGTETPDTVAALLADATLSASGRLTHKGVAARQVQDATSTGSGRLKHKGAAARSTANAASNSTGRVRKPRKVSGGVALVGSIRVELR
ncbi:MAG: hypothetical protein HY749_16240 [Gammaproteobacteria bacterium]|nr:hypothetical protein [Gammaproteobacteria bacterium]